MAWASCFTFKHLSTVINSADILLLSVFKKCDFFKKYHFMCMHVCLSVYMGTMCVQEPCVPECVYRYHACARTRGF